MFQRPLGNPGPNMQGDGWNRTVYCSTLETEVAAGALVVQVAGRQALQILHDVRHVGFVQAEPRRGLHL